MTEQLITAHFAWLHDVLPHSLTLAVPLLEVASGG